MENEPLWYDNPVVSVEKNNVEMAMLLLRHRKSEFGVQRPERRRRYSLARAIKRYKREMAEIRKQRVLHFTGR